MLASLSFSHVAFGACITAPLLGTLAVSAWGSGAAHKGPAEVLVGYRWSNLQGEEKKKKLSLVQKTVTRLVISKILLFFFLLCRYLFHNFSFALRWDRLPTMLAIWCCGAGSLFHNPTLNAGQAGGGWGWGFEIWKGRKLCHSVSLPPFSACSLPWVFCHSTNAGKTLWVSTSKIKRAAGSVSTYQL